MPDPTTILVIHGEGDEGLVRSELLGGLATEGYSHWISGLRVPTLPALSALVQDSAATLIVASAHLLQSTLAVRQAQLAGRAQRLPAVVRIAGFEAVLQQVPQLAALPSVDLTVEEDRVQQQQLVAALLPAVDPDTSTGPVSALAEPIEWQEHRFSAALRSATLRHDHARANALVHALVVHLSRRPRVYPPSHAYQDMQTLRQAREFGLMTYAGRALAAAGSRHDGVRRLYAQALIETRDFATAKLVLDALVLDADASRRERFEASGLLGRLFKQRYVDAPTDPSAEHWLAQAIDAYEGVYKQDPQQFWHGVNAASCMLRAARDQVQVGSPARARDIAQQVLNGLETLATAGPMEVWDCASRVEALVALERFDAASAALGDYLHHPALSAFEVSSTWRQFDQVLELGRRQPGGDLLARLQQSAQRYRAGRMPVDPRRGNSSPTAPPLHEAAVAAEGPSASPLVLRVSHPGWQPQSVPGLTIQSRLGTIITAQGTEQSVRALLHDSAVVSIEQSRPVGAPECDRSLPFIRTAAQYPGPTGPFAESGEHALVAVIDNGIDVLHQAFRDAAGHSRIVGVWDQTDPSGPPPAGFGYGTFHDGARVDAAVASGVLPGRLSRNDHGHGTHVASIAAGRAAGEFSGGVAPDARLLVVVSAGSGPIGYSKSHIEALVFIDRFATALNLPVVVNLSQGMNAGAHDGKSALEVAFDAFSSSGRAPGRIVVKSAGNERGKGGHAKVTVPTGSQEELRWTRAQGADATERLELWWSSADDIQFRLRSPAGDWTPVVKQASLEAVGNFSIDGRFQLTLTSRHVDNGDNLLLIELGDAGKAAGMGQWLLELTSGQAPDGGVVHAWIERSQGVPTTFVDHLDEEMTLSIPATAASVIAVGAVDASTPIRVAKFSSYGPTRDGQFKPQVCAPGVKVKAAEGGTDTGVYAESGTSMAAPHVTGAIALLLSRGAKSGRVPGANQVATALRQKAQHSTGRFDRGQGYGVVDVSALLAAF